MPRRETGTQTDISTGLNTYLAEEVKHLRYLVQSLVGVLRERHNNSPLVDEHLRDSSESFKGLIAFYKRTNDHGRYVLAKKLALDLHLLGFPVLIEVVDM